VWRSDAVHLYGVDIMNNSDCMAYFAEYGPVFVEWINDTSCNVVFADEHTARRSGPMDARYLPVFFSPCFTGTHSPPPRARNKY